MKDIKYLTDEFDKKIEQIKAIDAPLNFIFITDQHHNLMKYATNGAEGKYEDGLAHVEALRYVIEKCGNINCVIGGGDIGCDYSPDGEYMIQTVRELMDAMYSLPVPVHNVIGNHDDGLGVAFDRKYDSKKHVILPDLMHELVMKYNPTPENYYYVDFEEQNYRFVFLNSSDKPYFLDENEQYSLGWRLEFSMKQANWFRNEALATDKDIIVFCHSPICNEHLFGTENPPQAVKPFDDTLNAPMLYRAIKDTKNVVALIHGHVHYDNLLYDNDGLVTITTLCDMLQQWTPSCPKREVGTISEVAFDVMSLKDSLIHMTRFGAGTDRIAMMLRHSSWKEKLKK